MNKFAYKNCIKVRYDESNLLFISVVVVVVVVCLFQFPVEHKNRDSLQVQSGCKSAILHKQL